MWRSSHYNAQARSSHVLVFVGVTRIGIREERRRAHFAEETRVERGEPLREERRVLRVEVGELRAARVALLHELEHREHAGALQLREHRATLEVVRHHLRVRLDAPDEVHALHKHKYERATELLYLISFHTPQDSTLQ